MIEMKMRCLNKMNQTFPMCCTWSEVLLGQLEMFVPRMTSAGHTRLPVTSSSLSMSLLVLAGNMKPDIMMSVTGDLIVTDLMIYKHEDKNSAFHNVNPLDVYFVFSSSRNQETLKFLENVIWPNINRR